MAQLTDDCFAFGGSLMRIEDAVALISERLPVLAGTEWLPLGQADGRVAAEHVLALHDVPPFPNSAVDGYAIRHGDLNPAGETRLPVRGRLPAGAAVEEISGDGGAIRIFTGAPMPPGADTVFMQEDVRREGDFVVLPSGLKRGANARDAGEDIARGACAIPAGRRLRPQDLALAAASGHDRIAVRKRLRVALFSTGDELTEPGAPLPSGAIHDSNRVMLATLLTRLGIQVADLGILRDEPEALAERLRQAARDHDLILTSGGVSTGEEDHVKAAVEAVGALMFWRLAIKPGRPVAMGVVDGVPFVGLPGNPGAVYVTLLFVVRPLLARLGGALDVAPLGQPVRAAFAYRKKVGRREFVRVNVALGSDAVLEAVKYPRDGAGVLSSLTESDGLVELDDAVSAVAPGDILTFYPHAVLW